MVRRGHRWPTPVLQPGDLRPAWHMTALATGSCSLAVTGIQTSGFLKTRGSGMAPGGLKPPPMGPLAGETRLWLMTTSVIVWYSSEAKDPTFLMIRGSLTALP